MFCNNLIKISVIPSFITKHSFIFVIVIMYNEMYLIKLNKYLFIVSLISFYIKFKKYIFAIDVLLFYKILILDI